MCRGQLLARKRQGTSDSPSAHNCTGKTEMLKYKLGWEWVGVVREQVKLPCATPASHVKALVQVSAALPSISSLLISRGEQWVTGQVLVPLPPMWEMQRSFWILASFWTSPAVVTIWRVNHRLEDPCVSFISFTLYFK